MISFFVHPGKQISKPTTRIRVFRWIRKRLSNTNRYTYFFTTRRETFYQVYTNAQNTRKNEWQEGKFVKESDYWSSWNSYFVICPPDTIKPCRKIIIEMNIRIMLLELLCFRKADIPIYTGYALQAELRGVLKKISINPIVDWRSEVFKLCSVISCRMFGFFFHVNNCFQVLSIK